MPWLSLPIAFVKDRVREAVHRYIAREIDASLPTLQSKGGEPVSTGLRQALRRAKKASKTHPLWDKKFIGCLKSAVCNGQWPNTRLFSAGLGNKKSCNLCFAESGDLEHRHHCPRTMAARGSCISDKQCDRFIDSLDHGARHLLLTRALLAAPDLKQHRPNTEIRFE